MNLPLTIVGVAPRGFAGLDVDRPADFWYTSGAIGSGNPPLRRLTGRLRDGATRAEAQAEADLVWAALTQAGKPDSAYGGSDPDFYTFRQIRIDSGKSGYSELRVEFSEPLIILGLSTSIVLLVACANLASLLLVRGASRKREIGIRLALGTTRGRIVAQLLTESLIVAAAGGAVGAFFGYGGGQFLVAYLPPESAFVPKSVLDIRVLAFTILVSAASVVAFGLLPALRTVGVDPNAILHGAGTGTGRERVLGFHRGVVAGQVAFCLLLLVFAGLFANTLR